jgi:hypothetical protein
VVAEIDLVIQINRIVVLRKILFPGREYSDVGAVTAATSGAISDYVTDAMY